MLVAKTKHKLLKHEIKLNISTPLESTYVIYCGNKTQPVDPHSFTAKPNCHFAAFNYI